MAKPDVMAEKKRLIEAQEQARRDALAKKNFRRGEAARAAEPYLLLRGDGCYFNSAWLRRYLPTLGQRIEDKLPWETIPRLVDMPVGGTSFCKADALERFLDSGRAGVSLMGRLELFRLADLGELSDWEKADLGVPGGAVKMEPMAEERGLAVRFRHAQGRLMTADSDSVRSLDDLPGHLAEIAWAARGGDPTAGHCESLEACIAQGLEVGFDHAHSRVLWCRSMSREAPAEPEPEAEGAEPDEAPEPTVTTAAGGMPEIDPGEGFDDGDAADGEDKAEAAPTVTAAGGDEAKAPPAKKKKTGRPRKRPARGQPAKTQGLDAADGEDKAEAAPTVTAAGGDEAKAPPAKKKKTGRPRKRPARGQPAKTQGLDEADRRAFAQGRDAELDAELKALMAVEGKTAEELREQAVRIRHAADRMLAMQTNSESDNRFTGAEVKRLRRAAQEADDKAAELESAADDGGEG